jgi:hypothetical protein
MGHLEVVGLRLGHKAVTEPSSSSQNVGSEPLMKRQMGVAAQLTPKPFGSDSATSIWLK